MDDIASLSDEESFNPPFANSDENSLAKKKTTVKSKKNSPMKE